MITNYAKARVLKALFQLADEADFGTAIFIGLSTTKPNIDGTGVTEPSADCNYRRKMIATYNNSSYSNSDLINYIKYEDERGIYNHREIHFDETTAAGGTVAYVCYFDAETGGNLLAFNALPSPVELTPNTVTLFKVGELTINME